jgi:hypothetical protein
MGRVTSPSRVDVTMSAGRLLVRADEGVARPTVVRVAPKLPTDAAAATAATAVTVDDGPDGLRITAPEVVRRGRAPELLIELSVPPGTSVQASTGVGQVVGTGRLGGLVARTSSGSVGVEQVSGPVDIRTGRGPVTVHACGGGNVDVTDAVVIIRESHAPLSVRGRSGDVHVWWVGATTTVTTSTGNVRLGWDADQPVALHISTDTGRRAVTVPDTVEAAESLTVRTITGDVTVAPATSPQDVPARGPRALLSDVRRWAAGRRNRRA